ncbi:hypothetical protein [Bosea vestrisii]|uniref:Uncharacterized protein n=1 Tax=Bosea vestrisii TaxID=151416 RepID=A0ABW0H8R2_9HYPH
MSAGKIGSEAEGFIGLRAAMTRAEVKAAEDDETLSRRDDEHLHRRTRVTLIDAFYRAKLLNGDQDFDFADLNVLASLDAEAMRLRGRRLQRAGDRS